MLFSEAVTRVSDDTKIDSSRSGVSDRIKRELNRVSQQIWDGFQWSFRVRSYRIVTEIDETTGTVSLTNGSRTITGSSTAFLSKHATWHIYFPQDSVKNWYRIQSYSSATSLQMDVPYQGTSGGSKTYILRKFDYVLPSEILDLQDVTATANNYTLSVYHGKAINLLSPTPLYSGYPHGISLHQSDSELTTYTTGTLSGTIATTTITGSGTSWLDNVYPGDLVVIGSYTYTVREVDTDTQITLYNNQIVTSSAGTSYTIKRQFGRIARVMWPSSTDKHTIEISGYRKYANLVHDNDSNELLYRIPNVIINKASAMELKSQDDRRRRELEEEARLDLAAAQAEDDTITSKDSVAPIYSYRNEERRRIVS